MQKHLFAAVSAAAMLSAGAAFAQGLPFSTSNTNQSWSINREPAHDQNAFLSRFETPQPTKSATERSASSQDDESVAKK